MKFKKIIVIALSLFLLLPLCTEDTYAASQKTFWYNVKPSVMGEFNFSSTGKGTTTAVLYKVNMFGMKSKVSLSKLTKNKNNFKLTASLQKNTKYSLKVTYTGEKPGIYYGRNYDSYSSLTKQCGYSVSWQPIDGTYQPYTMQGIETRQIIYLTKGDAAIYCTGISESKYLKALDTGVKLTYLLTKWGISPYSGLANTLQEIGKSKIVTISKEIMTTYGGWKLIPKLSTTVINSLKKASNNFKNGVKVTVTYTNRGGLTNSYEKWDGKYSSIKGKEFCRGRFSRSSKVKGWY